MAKAEKLTDEECGKKIESILRAKDRGKKAYGAVDHLMEELIAGGFKPGRQIRLSGGRIVTLEDKFADKIKAFKPQGFNRYELKIDHDQP